MSSTTTFGTWAHRLGAFEELPAPFRAAFDAAGLGAERAFPLVIGTPEFRFDRWRSGPKLLVIAGDRIACLEEVGGAVRTTRLSAGDLFSIEWGRDLLEGWLALEAHGAAGPAALRVDFNAASSDVFWPVLTELRRARYAGAQADYGRELHKIGELRDRDLALTQLACQSLAEGEEVRRCHVQPATVLTAGGASVSYPAVLLLLSQRELLVLRGGGGQEAWYGAVWRYLDLERVERVDVATAEGRPGVTLLVYMPGEAVTTVECPGTGVAQLRAFADAILEARGRA